MGKHTAERNPLARARVSRFGRASLAAALSIGLALGILNGVGSAMVRTRSANADGIAAAVDTTGTPSASETVVSSGSVEAYRGLGTWVDIYDDSVFDHPEAAVKSMRARGVKTLYVETGNSSRTYVIKRPAMMRRLIRAAHGRGMKVVAWYLPSMRDVYKDYYRIKSAIRFRTYDGQRFDSFALDIESSVVKPVSERNKRLMRISNGIRRYAGPDYPLGAIIPSPWGMQRNSYWKPFPYQSLAQVYDVILPMSYYTYHGDGAALAYQDTLNNMSVLRSQPGCLEEPVHLIGGEAQNSSAAELRAFVRASNETTAIGASFYGYPETHSWHWSALASVTAGP